MEGKLPQSRLPTPISIIACMGDDRLNYSVQILHVERIARLPKERCLEKILLSRDFWNAKINVMRNQVDCCRWGKHLQVWHRVNTRR